MDSYTSNIMGCFDFYPFGMVMPGRNGGGDYRYGMNGMEQDDEVSGKGNSLTTPFRMYNPRLGRWMSTDPVTHPQFSPYSAFDNNPIYWSDPSGADSKGNGETDDDKQYRLSLNQAGLDLYKEMVKEINLTFNLLLGKPSKIGTHNISKYFVNGSADQTMQLPKLSEEGESKFEGFLKGYSIEEKAYIVNQAWNYKKSVQNEEKYGEGIISARNLSNIYRFGDNESIMKAYSNSNKQVSRNLAEIQMAITTGFGGSGAFNSGVKHASKTINFRLSSSGENMYEIMTFYRNVGDIEFGSLNSNGGKWTIKQNGFGGKQFWNNKEGLNFWLNTKFSSYYTAKITTTRATMLNARIGSEFNTYFYHTFETQFDLNKLNNNSSLQWIKYSAK